MLIWGPLHFYQGISGKNTMASKTIMRSVLALGLLSCAAAPALAAGPVASFQPAQAWSAGKANLSAGSTPLCTIQTQYNNGFVVGFSGAEKNLRSMSVNFRQDIFESGKNYDISFSIPGNPPQSLQARALNASTLSAGVQNTKNFYKTLRDSTAFDLGVEGNNFRFHLAGFNNGVAAFENCMASNGVNTSAPAKTKEAKSLVEPPNASPEMINESIALEEQEAQKKIAATEIPPGGAKQSVFPATETTKVDGIELTPEEASRLHSAAPKTRKRMSEELAAKIDRDPDIIDIENKPEELKTEGEKKAEAKAKESITPAPGPQETPKADATVNENIKIESAELAPIEAKSAAVIRPQNAAEKEAVKAAEPPLDEKPAMKVGRLEPDEKIIFNEPGKDTKPVNAPVIQPESKKKIQNYKTPDVVVKGTRIDAGTIDLTGIEPASNEKQRPFSGSYERIETDKDNKAPEPFKTASNTVSTNDGYRAPGEAPATPTKADPEMLRKISELEDLIRDLKAQNNVLKAGGTAPAGEDGSSISDANWNLERVTMRYTEAERELKRLGQQLQQERAQCNMQKQDIEAQLFDPQVTSQQQLARLGTLEQQLADAQRKLTDQRQQYEERIRILESRGATQ
jgi:hypothetical protein